MKKKKWKKKKNVVSENRKNRFTRESMCRIVRKPGHNKEGTSNLKLNQNEYAIQQMMVDSRPKVMFKSPETKKRAKITRHFDHQ